MAVSAVLVVAAIAWPTVRADPWEDSHRPPPLRLRVGAGRRLTIDNRSGYDVSLDVMVEVEQLLGGATRRWVSRPTGRGPSRQDLRLTTSCDESVVGGCRTIEAGRSLRIVPWSGLSGAAQCPMSTPVDLPAPAGRYRYVLRSCRDEWEFRSPPFDHIPFE